jgi:hypothetical protein
VQAARRRGVHVAAVERDLGAHLFEAAQMQVHGPCPDRAAAGQRDAGLAHPRQERAEHQDRGPHLAHDVVWGLGVADRAADGERPIRTGLETAPVLGDELRHRRDVGQLRHVGEHEPLVGQHAGRHERQRGVLGAADRDAAFERPAAADADPIHAESSYIRGSATPRWRMYFPALSA